MPQLTVFAACVERGPGSLKRTRAPLYMLVPLSMHWGMAPVFTSDFFGLCIRPCLPPVSVFLLAYKY